MTFELQDAVPGRGSAATKVRWSGTADLDLTDPGKNRDRYDDVTRTYLFRLKVGGVDLPDTAQLHAEFQSVDGQVFEGDYILPSTTRSVTGPQK